MSTSGSVDFTMDASELIEEAFKLIGIKPAETALEAFEIQDGLNTLNLMLKAWQGQSMHLWTQEEGVLFLDIGKTDYLVGPTGDEATTNDDFIGTTTTAALVATNVIIPVVSTVGMTTGDTAGVQLDDGTRHWTTLTVDSTVQVTLAVGVPSAAASGNSLFTFTTLIQRPLRISSFRRKTFSEDNEIRVQKWSRSQYFNQVNKASQGTVVNAYFSPLLDNGRVFVWQTASSVNDFLRFTFERPIEDIDLSTDNLDIPVEWLQTVIYNLAARLADSYDAPQFRVQSVTAKAVAFLEEMLGWDEEMTSLNLQPDFD